MQLKNDIVEKIENNIWSVDEQIPSEKELMRLNDVGRETVRKAVAMLVQEGYLIKRRGIGTFIANKKPRLGFEPIISLSHTLQVRGLREKNRVLKNEKKILDQELAQLTKMEEDIPCRYIKRLRYVEGKPLALEHAYIDNQDDEIPYSFEHSITNYLLKIRNIQITKIEQVITPRSPEEAEIDMLGLKKNVRVLELDRWIYIEGQDNVYFYIKFIIPEDIYELTM